MTDESAALRWVRKTRILDGAPAVCSSRAMISENGNGRRAFRPAGTAACTSFDMGRKKKYEYEKRIL